MEWCLTGAFAWVSSKCSGFLRQLSGKQLKDTARIECLREGYNKKSKLELKLNYMLLCPGTRSEPEKKLVPSNMKTNLCENFTSTKTAKVYQLPEWIRRLTRSRLCIRLPICPKADSCFELNSN